jgi:hypothetical protein
MKSLRTGKDYYDAVNAAGKMNIDLKKLRNKVKGGVVPDVDDLCSGIIKDPTILEMLKDPAMKDMLKEQFAKAINQKR